MAEMPGQEHGCRASASHEDHQPGSCHSAPSENRRETLLSSLAGLPREPSVLEVGGGASHPRPWRQQPGWRAREDAAGMCPAAGPESTLEGAEEKGVGGGVIGKKV